LTVEASIKFFPGIFVEAYVELVLFFDSLNNSGVKGRTGGASTVGVDTNVERKSRPLEHSPEQEETFVESLRKAEGYVMVEVIDSSLKEALVVGVIRIGRPREPPRLIVGDVRMMVALDILRERKICNRGIGPTFLKIVVER